MNTSATAGLRNAIEPLNRIIRIRADAAGGFDDSACAPDHSMAFLPLETQILKNEGDAERLGTLLADAEIVVGHIWRASFPPAPRLRA
jgi:hypothetical protein